MQAVILAAGISSRMLPLTKDVPKPMLLLAGKPVMEHVIKKLQYAGITEIIITVHYLPYVIKDYFGDGSGHGVQISYAYEPKRMDTAGSLKRITHLLDDSFLVCGGHFYLPQIDFDALFNAHYANDGLLTIVFKVLDDPSLLPFFGQGILAETGRLINFHEKPQQQISRLVHTTYQVFRRDALDIIPEGMPVSIPDFVIPELLRLKMPIYGYITESELLNVSNYQLYERAQQLMIKATKAHKENV